MGGHAEQGSDKGAAFLGLIGGSIFIGAIMYAVVIWTNGKFAGHEAEKPGAMVTATQLPTA